MGRHSSSQQSAYYRSVVAWFLPWLLVAAVAVTTMWIAIDALGGGEPSLQAGGAPARRSQPPASSDPTPSPSPPDPSNGPEEGDPGGKDKDKESQSASPSPALQAHGMSVQVLNGTSSTAADDAMAERLSSLGFEIAAIAGATTYADTTVFWSHEDARPVAEALAARYGWSAAPKPANLSPSVDLHVVVGADEL